MLPLLLALTLVANHPAPLPPTSPPWAPAADETALGDSPTFKPCHDALAAMTKGPRDRVDRVTYARSPQWGWVLRARLVTVDPILKTTDLFTCWSTTGAAFDIAVRPEHLT